MAVESGSGEINVIVDLKDFQWKKCPPLSVVRAGIPLLKLHYPYRLRSVNIVNAGSAFTLLWQIVKPLLSKKTKGKTKVLSMSNWQSILVQEFGKEFLEVDYGGDVHEKINAATYYAEDYWYPYRQAWKNGASSSAIGKKK